jgi:hypothetical protein
MRLDLKMKTLVATLQLMQQLVVVVVATEVDAMVGVEDPQISSVAMSIMAMSNAVMSNMAVTIVEVTIHMEVVMVGVCKVTVHRNNSTEVKEVKTYLSSSS